MNRFDYVKYDEISIRQQESFKKLFQEMEKFVDTFAEGRAKSLIFTKLEEAYMWVGKAIRDDQLYSRGALLQEERNNS
jgi:hypothetical protein